MFPVSHILCSHPTPNGRPGVWASQGQDQESLQSAGALTTNMSLSLFLRERERERERESTYKQGRGRERIPSRLPPVSVEPDVGLELTDSEIMT